MRIFLIAVLLCGTYSTKAFAICPYDPNCLNNPYGAGSPYKTDGVNNPYNWVCEMYGNGFYKVQDGNVYQEFSDGKTLASVDEKGNQDILPLEYQTGYIGYIFRHIASYF